VFKQDMKDALKKIEHEKIKGPVKLKLVFAFKTKRKRDLDNYFKRPLQSQRRCPTRARLPSQHNPQAICILRESNQETG
jgi:hypothetical protein